ncbi:hypothetical protein BN2497_10133 [Janthinobacterium sp. CG23_2]|nr:hypothetical protein BN2497_10133 [Janthinobacterium sp. CG23_2]CUU31464.1 hypothetical protein BN3177_10133 [Janthinobacterium sp. CG23_2]
MKIRSLPPKKQLTFFEVQFFVNEGKQGKAKNVLAVRYSTHPNLFRAKNDESVQFREYFDLTSGREINRKTKKHFGLETSQKIKQSIKALLVEQDITTMFGIRQIRYKLPHKRLPGKWFYKRQLDINNLVFVHVTEEKFTANFSWESEEISVVVSPHKGQLAVGQSVGVGYYTSASSNAELAERLLELKSARAMISVANDIKPTTPVANDDTVILAPKDERTAVSEAEVDIPEQACERETEYGPSDDVYQTPASGNAPAYHRKRYVQRTEYDVFQEMCKNSVYVDDTKYPMINLGLSFQLPFETHWQIQAPTN